MAALLAVLLAFPFAAGAESLTEALDQTVDGLDTTQLEAALGEEDPFRATGGFRETVRKVARGELTLSFEQLCQLFLSRFASAWTGSVWRITRLMVPALLWGVTKRLSGKASLGGEVVCSLMVCAFLTQDLREHMALCQTTVRRMSEGMQGLFPLLLTMMAAVGGASASAVMQPAVAAACGGMTQLLSSVTLPLSSGAAVLTMLCHLGPGIRVQRLAKLLVQAASWTLGFSLTAFVGVLATRGVTAAAVDGITIRTAKYALDNFVPIVGGLFADTMDALVGSGMLVQSALGVTGLLMMVSLCAGPLCQTFASALLYKLAAALLQPVADGEMADCIHDFAGILTLMFVIELSTAAMFLLMTGQLVAVSGATIMIR